jgi:uncharacterized protein (TIGR02231 family)
LTTDVASVRVSGAGTARVRILGVDVKRIHYTESPAAHVTALEAQIEQLHDELHATNDEQNALQAQAKLLDGIRENTLEFARSLSRGRLTTAEQAQQMQFLLDQDREVKTAIRELTVTIRDLSRQIEKLKRELKELQSTRPPVRYAALIEVETNEACEFRPNLSYVVTNAGWQPLYDARLIEDAERTLELSYLAQVTNSSGLDWNDVQLSVSTARPALNQRKPELRPWYIGEREPIVRRAKAMGKPAAAGESEMMFESVMPMMADVAAEEVFATAETSGATVTFRIPGTTTIPSDRTAHKSTIGRFNFKPAIDYLAVPRHTDSVFRRIKAVNASGSPLLAGSINLFVGDEFIGSNQIEYTANSAELELLLGVEERIVIERELVRRDVDKKLLRDQRQIRYGYKIEIENLLPFAADVTIEDQIPVSKHEEVKVKLEDVTPQSAEMSDMNIMKWQLRLESAEKRTITYEFSVQHPRSIELYGITE